MQAINFLLAAIVSYLGLAAGIILIYIAPEEQKPGKKYFSFLRYILYALILLFLLFFNYKNIFLVSSIILFLAVFLLLNEKQKIVNLKKVNNLNKSLIIYLVLAIIFFLSAKNTDLFLIESSLIFLYGIPTSSFLFNIKRKNHMEILSKHSLFIIASLLIFLIFQ